VLDEDWTSSWSFACSRRPGPAALTRRSACADWFTQWARNELRPKPWLVLRRGSLLLR
jgi:hypothetical protein